MQLLVRMGWHGLLRGVAEDQRPGLYVKQVVAPEHPAEHPDIDGLFLYLSRVPFFLLFFVLWP